MATVNLSSIITPANIVTTTGTATLTNKTINIASNTLTGVQPTLVSGTSIKTINSTSLLGSGNIALSSALTLLSTVTASYSSTVDIETTFDSTYDAYLLVASNIKLASTVALNMRFKISGSYISTGTYFYHCVRSNSNGATYGGTDQSVGGNTKILIADTAGGIASESASIQFLITGPTSTTQAKQVSWSGSGWYNSLATMTQNSGAGGNTGTGALTGVQLFAQTGSIQSGTFRLYGIANS